MSSQGGISRVVHYNPHSLAASTTVSPAPPGICQRCTALGEAYPCPARHGRGQNGVRGRPDAEHRRTNRAGLSQSFPVAGRGQFGLPAPARATGEADENATPGTRGLDRGGAASGGLCLRLLERHHHSRPHPASLWGGLPSHYICTLLDNLGFSYQKARFVSAHLDEATRLEWRHHTWPKVLRKARQRKALLLFGDEASFAQWGSLSYTWALKGHQPEVPTSGIRRAYKVFGLIDYFSGRFFYKAHTERFNSDSYAAFLLDVLAQTHQHVFVIQDGARYHTSKAMGPFFAAHATRLTKVQLPAYSRSEEHTS